MNNINKDIDELLKYFRIWNYNFFNNELPEQIIIIQASRKKFLNGWITTEENWESKDNFEKLREITIVAQSLKRPHINIAETVLHEMCHLYNIVHGIKDTAGKIHNKKFKETAEKHGLIVLDRDKYVGYGFTQLNDKAKKIFETVEIDKNAFSYYHTSSLPSLKDKEPKIKYKCSNCGKSFTLKFLIYAGCPDCNQEFESEEKTE